MAYRNNDRHHQPLIKLDRPQIDKNDRNLRNALLHKAERKRLWKAACVRVLANPNPMVNAKGIAAITGILRQLSVPGPLNLSRKQMKLIDTADWKRPCGEPGCTCLAYFTDHARGFCKAHEAAYWHHRRVFDEYRRIEQRGVDVTEQATKADDYLRQAENARRANFRRKSKHRNN